VVEWSGTVVLTTPRLLLRTFRRDDLPSYAITAEQWRSGAAAARRGVR
jgi:hypothetical protein